MSGSESRDDAAARWQKKQLHYQDEIVVARYDEERFRTRHERASTGRKWRAIQRALAGRLPSGAEVLDLPSGRGRFTARVLGDGYRLTSADLSLPMLGAARETAGDAPGFHGAVRCDAARLPFADGSFDLVMSIRFLFHVPRALRAGILREFARVSRRFVVVDVRHKYCYATHTKRWKARLLGRPPPTPRASLSEIGRDFADAGLAIERRIWLAPGLSEKMLVVCRKP